MTAATERSRLDWNALRIFLEIARAGSAHAAATILGVDHSTVGRQLKSLEARLGSKLVNRVGNRLLLTTDGVVALQAAQRMEATAVALAVDLNGADASLAGDVRINVTEGLGTYWLVPAMLPFQEQHQNLKLNWLTTTLKCLVPGKETDVAVWWWRPTEPWLVGRRLGDVGYSLYCSAEYAKNRGLPGSLAELDQHSLLHFNAYDLSPPFERWRDVMRKIRPAMRVVSTMTAVPLILSGRFISLLPDYAQIVAPQIVRAPVDTEIRLEVWLVYHEDCRSVSRIRAVTDEISRLSEAAQGTWLRDLSAPPASANTRVALSA